MDFEQWLFSLWEHADVSVFADHEGSEHRVINNPLKKKKKKVSRVPQEFSGLG